MKAFMDKVKGWLFPLVAALLVIAIGFGAILYHSYTELEHTAEKQATEISRIGEELRKAEGINKTLSDENTRLKGSATITEGVKDGVAEKAKELDSRYSEMQKQVSDKLKAIETKYKAQGASRESDDRKAVEISLERSRGVWLLFCLAEPKAKECN